MTTTKEVRGSKLGHRFPGTAPLFTGLDFTMRPGQIVGLCGPSGSGKSTLLSILAGWVEPTAGTVDMIGVQRTGWVFQNPYGVPGRTALDLVCLPLLARGQTRPAAEHRAREVLASFRLDRAAGQAFRELSGGEAQRLMLARAVCAAPDLLLVDEPTAQLDVTTAATVNETLGAIAQDGTIVVIATHDPHTRDACTHVIDLAAPALHAGALP
jgi:ABC-type lipoprotein export system ATPase subunit